MCFGSVLGVFRVLLFLSSSISQPLPTPLGQRRGPCQQEVATLSKLVGVDRSSLK